MRSFRIRRARMAANSGEALENSKALAIVVVFMAKMKRPAISVMQTAPAKPSQPPALIWAIGDLPCNRATITIIGSRPMHRQSRYCTASRCRREPHREAAEREQGPGGKRQEHTVESRLAGEHGGNATRKRSRQNARNQDIK